MEPTLTSLALQCGLTLKITFLIGNLQFSINTKQTFITVLGLKTIFPKESILKIQDVSFLFKIFILITKETLLAVLSCPLFEVPHTLCVLDKNISMLLEDNA